MILEVYLDYFVGEPEHDSMSCTHPLFDIYYFFDLSLLLSTALSILLHDTLWLIITLKVTPEMLEKSYFLLELFWVLSKGVLLAYILTITGSSLHVVDMVTIWVKHDLS